MRSKENTHAHHVQHVEFLDVQAGSHDKQRLYFLHNINRFYIRHCLCVVRYESLNVIYINVSL